jgi:hypothetical protein
MSTIDIVNFTLHIGLKTKAYQNYYEQLLALDVFLSLLVGGGVVRIAIYANIIGGRSFTILFPSVCCLSLYILLFVPFLFSIYVATRLSFLLGPSPSISIASLASL